MDSSEHSANLPEQSVCFVVIDLNVRRNQPQSSNFAVNIRTRQSHCGSCRYKGGRCRGTNGNSSYIFSAEKCTFIIKYSKVWKWCRTFSANFFDLNVRHLTCLRSFCVEHSGQLPEATLSNILLKKRRQWFVHRPEVDRRLPQEDQHCLQIDIELKFHCHSTAATINRLLPILIPESGNCRLHLVVQRLKPRLELGNMVHHLCFRIAIGPLLLQGFQ